MSASDFDFPTMARALILGDKDTVAKKTREGLDLAMEPKELIFKGLIPGMDVVGEKFRRNEYYVPQVLLSARAMYAGLDLLKPLITAAARPDDNLGIVVIGTAQGDLRSEEHTSELQSHSDLVCRLLLEKKKKQLSTNSTSSTPTEQ